MSKMSEISSKMSKFSEKMSSVMFGSKHSKLIISIYIIISVIVIFILSILLSSKSCSSYIPIKSWNPGYSTATMGYISDNVCMCGGPGGRTENCQNRELKHQSYDKGNTEYTKLENQGYKSTNFNDYS